MYLDYVASCDLIRKIPLSCICSWNLQSSFISNIKLDRDEKVHQTKKAILNNGNLYPGRVY